MRSSVSMPRLGANEVSPHHTIDATCIVVVSHRNKPSAMSLRSGAGIRDQRLIFANVGVAMLEFAYGGNLLGKVRRHGLAFRTASFPSKSGGSSTKSAPTTVWMTPGERSGHNATYESGVPTSLCYKYCRRANVS